MHLFFCHKSAAKLEIFSFPVTVHVCPQLSNNLNYKIRNMQSFEKQIYSVMFATSENLLVKYDLGLIIDFFKKNQQESSVKV